jgi:choline-sulfatase
MKIKLWNVLLVGGLMAGIARAQPDVLVIAIDDLNDWVGCLGGHPQAYTPNIDRLAARGLLFENAHVQAPICNPSRASFMSGIYPSTSEIVDNSKSAKQRTLEFVGQTEMIPQCFTRGGYRTAGCGKIFHTWPGLENEGFFDDPGPVWEYGYLPNHGKLPMRKKWGAVKNPEKTCFDYNVADWTCGKLSTWGKEEPQFLMAGFFRPHAPMYAPQEYFDRYPLDEVQLPPIKKNDRDDLPQWVHENMPVSSYMKKFHANPELLKSAAQAYLASTAFVDAQIGKVLDQLDASGRADSTIVVLFSDHGFHIGEKDHWSKHSGWEESTRVPFILAGPGIPVGKRCSKSIGLIDLYPTLVELCGLEAPTGLEGRSLVPLIQDPSGDWNYAAATVVENGALALRNEHWRYILYPDGSEELYDHRNDPNEWTNLALKPECGEQAKIMKQMLLEQLGKK